MAEINKLSDPGQALWLKARGYLAQMFEESDHRPSERLLGALHEVITVMCLMLENKLQPKIFRCALDTGVGKSSAVIAFLMALKDFRSIYDDVGLMVCLARLDEVNNYAERANLPDDMYACYTSDKKINELGLGRKSSGKAQIIFTTQQMIAKRLERENFEWSPDFRYLGNARQWRVWDESWLPGETIILSRSELYAIAGSLEKSSEWYFDLFIEEFLPKVRRASPGAVIDVPKMYSSEREKFLQVADRKYRYRQYQEFADQAVLLSRMAGRQVRMRDNNAMMFVETMPEDIMPLLVMDASARVRETYNELEKHAYFKSEKLITAPKNYMGVTHHVWRRAGGQNKWRQGTKSRKTLIDGVASILNNHISSHERTLVVCYKNSNIEKELKGLVAPGIWGNTSIITHGEALATSNYRDYENLVMAGTMFYRGTVGYEALGRLCCGLRVEDGEYPEENIKRIMLGEHAHNLLQASGRIRIRRSIGNGCPPANIYIIAAKSTGVEAVLQKVHPGSTQRLINPLNIKRGSSTRGAMWPTVAHYLGENRDHVSGITPKELSKLVDTPTKQLRNLLAREDCQADLTTMGLQVIREGRKVFIVAMDYKTPRRVTAEEIVAKRTAKGMSQVQFAKELGVSRRMLSYAETDKHRLPPHGERALEIET